MASNATLTIKVGANVKDAAQQLQALGYNIENVKKKTDKANDSASTWEQTLKKTTENSINKVVELGSKYLSLATAVTVASSAMKKLFEEGTKYNNELGKQVEEIGKKYESVLGQIGAALTETFRPILEDIDSALNTVNMLGIISKGPGNVYSNVQYAASSGKSLESYSTSTLQAALANAELYNKTKVVSILQKEIEAREKSAQTIKSATETVKSSAETVSSSLKTASNYLSEKTISDKEAVLGYSSSRSKDLKAIKLGSYANLAQEKIDAGDLESKYYKEALEAINEEIEALAEDTSSAWQDAFSDIYSSAKSCFSGIFSFMDAYYDRQISNINNSEMAEEEKNARINELEKKKFYAEQVNSYSEAAMSYAEGMIDIWSKYASAPWVAGTLTALLTANTGLQFATISQQTYTPSLAEGGIVTSPTHAYIGEGAENEAVIPLSKLEDFVNRDSSGGTIVLNITCNGQTSETEVFHAIERAQRTGLLPNWRYA